MTTLIHQKENKYNTSFRGDVSVGLAWDSPAWGCGLALKVNLTFNIRWV
jgi:hypothetical protein